MVACDSALQLRLEESQANGLFGTCKKWCTYDFQSVKENEWGGYIWKPEGQCWHFVNDWFCFRDSVALIDFNVQVIKITTICPGTIPPSASPSVPPTFPPSQYPTLAPTPNPSMAPTPNPSLQPSAAPTSNPTSKPSTSSPTYSPTNLPTQTSDCSDSKGVEQNVHECDCGGAQCASNSYCDARYGICSPYPSCPDQSGHDVISQECACGSSICNVDQICTGDQNDCAKIEACFDNTGQSAVIGPDCVCIDGEKNDICTAGQWCSTLRSSLCSDSPPTETPTWLPTMIPTMIPTLSPTSVPTQDPTLSTHIPTFAPTEQPTVFPSLSPTTQPTLYPSEDLTAEPTRSPTVAPTTDPTFQPSPRPTVSPSRSPSESPTGIPTYNPSGRPATPSDIPTQTPSLTPTNSSTEHPTYFPSESRTYSPSESSTYSRSESPTYSPNESPIYSPSESPTNFTSESPTYSPSDSPTYSPSESPIYSPSESPTYSPSESPTYSPAQQPTHVPADMNVYEMNWVLGICCIEESKINETIPPVAESLGLDVSSVHIEFYTVFDSSRRRGAEVTTKKLRRLSSVTEGAWDIEYLLQVAGMNNALNTEVQLKDATFVNQIGGNISRSMNIELDFISTKEVDFPKASVPLTSSPSKAPATFPLAASQQSTFSTTALPIIIFVIVGTGFLVISICALKFDYKAIKMDRLKPLHSRLLPSSI